MLQISDHLGKCFGEFEACKQLPILGILGSNGNAGQHEAGDELEVHFDVKPGGEEDKHGVLVTLSQNSSLRIKKNKTKQNSFCDAEHQHHINNNLTGRDDATPSLEIKLA